jgi:hypothetical protein
MRARAVHVDSTETAEEIDAWDLRAAGPAGGGVAAGED